ncbi:hypothetical protein [Spiroplasma corruscae]|uniref:hypothetical protein n=1 Tax=Spiroplasma corruscae TaxID=216934 RepID=UPI0012FD4545|nr:hypothetical protein [Spiroplasma corruscae]
MKNLSAIIYVMYFFNNLLLLLFITIFVVTISSLSKKRSIALLYLILFFIYSICFSDSIMDANLLNKNIVYVIIGYLNPIKYFIWTNMLITSYTFIDFYGITQIISDYFNGGYAPFYNLWMTLLPSLLFITVIAFVYWKKFYWGFKK